MGELLKMMQGGTDRTGFADMADQYSFTPRKKEKSLEDILAGLEQDNTEMGGEESGDETGGFDFGGALDYIGEKGSNVKDFLEENFDEDELEEDELEIDRLGIDLLSVDFLMDLLAFIEGQDEVSKIGDVTIEGIMAGYDAKAQTYSFVEGEMLTFYRSVENTIDLQIEKQSAYNIQILSAGKFINITVNGGGDGKIIINQSD